ncbi:hypothetical protein HRI_002995900 [Hibiscus trionum]|uniref:Cystatin domain-containing protein n=1 Tax=Hibiscus trionum TaxID=183268 RepID=A0A9W7IEW6_HIBTR|nr:hypothetical protein HRI_002995900 [Hibiscus trionum]
MQQFHHFLALVLPLIFLPLVTSAFAVDQYNKEGNTGLKLVAVVSGETQVVSGTNYRLILKATDETAPKTYQAIVWENDLLNKKLTSFEPFLG